MRPLIAEFKKTLMGKISDTPQGKGKFECENCHGPGSAHVKAGGGRGVGGIMSFEADDPRTSEEKNGICLACHQRGERNYWAGSVHEDARRLPAPIATAVMRSVSRKNNLKTTVEAETCFQCHKDGAHKCSVFVAYAASRGKDYLLELPQSARHRHGEADPSGLGQRQLLHMSC